MGRRKIYTGEWDNKLKELYEEGMSFYEMYKKYGIHPQTVKDRITSLGAKIRSKDEAYLKSKRRREGEQEERGFKSKGSSSRRNRSDSE